MESCIIGCFINQSIELCNEDQKKKKIRGGNLKILDEICQATAS